MVSEEETTDGDLLEREAEALEDLFDAAAADHSPDLEWFGMGYNHNTDEQQFVFETTEYVDSSGLAALRDRGYPVRYIETYEYGGEVRIQVEFPVREEVP